MSTQPSYACSFQNVTEAFTNVAEVTADDDLGSAFSDSDSADVTIAANAVPVADDQTVSVDENTSVLITLTGGDPDGDAFEFIILTLPTHGVLSDGTTIATSTPFTLSGDGVTYTPDADYDGPDEFDFKTNDGTSDSNTATVSIDVLRMNVTPVADAGGPYSGNEGDSINLDASGSFDPDGAIVLYEWDLDNDGAFDDATGIAPAVTFGDNGVFTVRLHVSDGVLTDTDTAEVTVGNVAPTVDAGLDATIDEGDTFTSSGSFSDPGADTWTAIVDYGDGSGPQPLPLNPDKSFSLGHTYDNDGVYAVTVTVDDGDDGLGTRSAEVTVLDAVLIAGCEFDALISDYQTTPGSGQFVEIANVGIGPMSLDECSLVTYNVFTETTIGAGTVGMRWYPKTRQLAKRESSS